MLDESKCLIQVIIWSGKTSTKDHLLRGCLLVDNGDDDGNDDDNDDI